MNELIGLFGRIPMALWSVLLVSAGAYAYLRWISTDTHKTVLLDVLGTFVITDVLVSRLSPLVLFPTNLSNLNFFTLLGAPGASGWLFGGGIALLLSAFSLHRRGALKRGNLTTTATELVTAMVWGGVLFFGYDAWVSLSSYRTLALVRLLLSLAIGVWLWRMHGRLRLPLRVVGIIGGLLLATSLWVPRMNLVGALTVPQWVFASLVVLAITNEAVRDIRNRSDSQKIARKKGKHERID